MGYLIPVTPQAFVNRHIYHNLLSISNQFCTNYIHISRLQLTFLHHIKSRSTSNFRWAILNSIMIWNQIQLISWSNHLISIDLVRTESKFNLDQIKFDSIQFDSSLIDSNWIESNYLISFWFDQIIWSEFIIRLNYSRLINFN